MRRGDQDNRVSVAFTIDVEPDNAWEDHLNPSVANVQTLLGLQKLLDKYTAKATCLVTHRVVQDAQAVDVLKELADNGGAEIGTHLHPWETPPFMDSGIDTKYLIFPHELPVDVFKQKLGRLTEAISRHFDPPTSYRGGRWSITAEHVPVLEEFGYTIDTSVTPLIDWRDKLGVGRRHNGRGGIDFSFAPQWPYCLSRQDIMKEGDSSILEMPVSVAFTRPTPWCIKRNYPMLPVVVRRVLRKSEILRPVWATPAEETRRHLSKMINVMLRQDTAFINMTVHSSELMIDGSPRSRTDVDISRILDSIDMMLGACARHHRCQFTTLREEGARRGAGGE